MSGVALWDAEGDDDAEFRKELDGTRAVAHAPVTALTPATCAGVVAEEAAREPSGGHDGGGKARARTRYAQRSVSGWTHKLVRRSRVCKRARSAAWTAPTTCRGTG